LDWAGLPRPLLRAQPPSRRAVFAAVLAGRHAPARVAPGHAAQVRGLTHLE